MSHKAGFVNIIGNPNVGKSTLLNALVGEKISIITHKSQTTRHRILGIVSEDNFQIVFSDTPGILTPHYRLQQCMLHQVENALSDADLFLLVTDLGESLKSKEILDRIKQCSTPVIVVINKVDTSTQEKINGIIEYWEKEIPRAEIVPCSALLHVGVEKVMELVLKYLPDSPAYYEKDALTDRNMRFLVSEIIREKILLRYSKEIPYSTGERAKVRCYGANDVREGVAIMHHEDVDVSITGNSTNPTRFQHPVAGTYKKECYEKGKKYFSVASGGGTGRTLHPDNMAAGPASYGMTDTMGRMHSDAQFAGSSSVPAHVEMMGLIGMGNNPMVGATVSIAVAVEEAMKK